MNDLERMIEHSLAHEFGIESTGGRLPVMRGQLLRQMPGPRHVKPPAAPRPKQELGNTLQVSEISSRRRVVFRQNGGRVVRNAVFVLFQGQPNVTPA